MFPASRSSHVEIAIPEIDADFGRTRRYRLLEISSRGTLHRKLRRRRPTLDDQAIGSRDRSHEPITTASSTRPCRGAPLCAHPDDLSAGRSLGSERVERNEATRRPPRTGRGGRVGVEAGRGRRHDAKRDGEEEDDGDDGTLTLAFRLMVETPIRHLTLKFSMLQPPSPLLEMASLRLPDSEEFDVDTRRRSNNGNVPVTTVASAPPGTGTLLQMRNDLGDYLNNLITEAIATTSPRATMEDQIHGLFNASKTNLSAIEQTPDRLYRHSMAMSAVYCVAYVVVFVVGLIGNSFVIAVVYRSPRMRTVTNFFIVNLAVADVLVIVFCLPATLMSNIFVRKYLDACW